MFWSIHLSVFCIFKKVPLRRKLLSFKCPRDPDVVEEGIDRCQKWFNVKWQECMDAIKAPIINHILCVSMKFHFLCDAMRGRTLEVEHI